MCAASQRVAPAARLRIAPWTVYHLVAVPGVGGAVALAHDTAHVTLHTAWGLAALSARWVVLTGLLIGSAAVPPLRAQTASPTQQPIALRHVNVVDVRSARVLPDRTIVTTSGHITAVLPPRAAVPEAARVVDGGGAYAIPGLWDTHVHLSYLGTCALPVFVANGVTSVRDAGARMDEVEHWRDEIGRAHV